MRWTNVYIDATACRLGDPVDLREAVADGRYDRSEYEENGLSQVVVAADGEYPADMAVSAAQDALKRARAVRPEDVGMFLHASVYFQGQEYWTSRARSTGRRRRTCSSTPPVARPPRWRSGRPRTGAWQPWRSAPRR